MKSIRKALLILDTLARAPTDMSLTELAQALDAHVSTLHHILQFLRQEGYLRQDSQSRRYALGHQALILGEAARRQTAVVSLAFPVMDELVRLCGETVTLGILKGGAVLYILQREGSNSMRMNTQPGSTGPLHSSASGKLFLAYSDLPDPTTELTFPLPANTPNTLTSREGLSSHLAAIREQGYAIDQEEREIGMVCVAAPIFNSSSGVEASLTLSGPTSRMEGAALQERIARVTTAASTVSAHLGHLRNA